MFINKSRATICGIILIIICLSFVVKGNEDKLAIKSIHKYALLIGINSYPGLSSQYQLVSCLNDIALMKSMLLEKGFEAKDIVELADNKAKKSSILFALEKLKKDVEPNDIVVVHFSGHGSQVPDLEKKEADGLQETLLPYDYVYSYEKARSTAILDTEMDKWLSAITQVTPNVTVIVDACNSAGASRLINFKTSSYYPPRYVPAILTHKDSVAISRLPPDQQKKEKFPYVFVAACESSELANQFPSSASAPAIVYGALTYFLVKEIRAASGSTLWPDIIANVKDNVHTYFPDQTPEVLGDRKNSGVLGDKVILPAPFVYVSPAGDHLATLQEGKINGVEAGSVYDVYPPGTIDFSKSAPVAKISVDKVDAFTASCKVITGAITKSNSKARETIHNYSAASFHLYFSGNWATNNLQKIKADILTDRSIIEDKSNPDVIAEIQNDSVKLRLGTATRVVWERPLANPSWITDLDRQIALWEHWFDILRMSNTMATVKFTVTFSSTRDLELINRMNHPDYQFKDGEIIDMKITNNSSAPLYFNIIDLMDNGKMMPYSLKELLDQAGDEPISPDSFKMAQLRLNVSELRESSIDIIKVYGSTKNILLKDDTTEAFNNEKKNLRELIFRKRSESTATIIDDWNVVSKVILLTK